MIRGRPDYTVLADLAGDEPPEMFQDFARRIGLSRPYVSQRVAEGVIHGEALIRYGSRRLIVPALALRQMAEAADPSRGPSGAPATDPAPHAPASPAIATARSRKIEADASAAELDLDIKRGRYLDRATAGPAISGYFRSIRDAVVLALRDNPERPEQAVLDAFAQKSAELTHVFGTGGPPPG